MILPRYHIAASHIPGAGKGLFLDEPVARGRLLTAPDDIRKVYKWNEVQALPDAAALLASTVRWFEDRYTVTPEWPDECYINHSFEPDGATTPVAPGAALSCCVPSCRCAAGC